jgi:hypothetical protein
MSSSNRSSLFQSALQIHTSPTMILLLTNTSERQSFEWHCIYASTARSCAHAEFSTVLLLVETRVYVDAFSQPLPYQIGVPNAGVSRLRHQHPSPSYLKCLQITWWAVTKKSLEKQFFRTGLGFRVRSPNNSIENQARFRILQRLLLRVVSPVPRPNTRGHSCRIRSQKECIDCPCFLKASSCRRK